MVFWIKQLLQEVTMNHNTWIYSQNWQRNIFSYYNHIVADLLQTKAISTGKPVLANSWKAHSLILEGRGTVTFYRCLHSHHPNRVKSLFREMGPIWNAALTSSQVCAHSHPWHRFSQDDQTQQPQKLNTVQHPQIEPEFWGSPSSCPTAELQTLSCQRTWNLFKGSSSADGNNQTQPVLPSTAQPQHPVRSSLRSTPQGKCEFVLWSLKQHLPMPSATERATFQLTTLPAAWIFKARKGKAL